MRQWSQQQQLSEICLPSILAAYFRPIFCSEFQFILTRLALFFLHMKGYKYKLGEYQERMHPKLQLQPWVRWVHVTPLAHRIINQVFGCENILGPVREPVQPLLYWFGEKGVLNLPKCILPNNRSLLVTGHICSHFRAGEDLYSFPAVTALSGYQVL